MVLRRPNLLDAFRQTKPSSAAAPSRPTEVTPPVAAAPTPPRPPARAPVSPPSAAPWQPPGLPRGALLGVAVVIAGIAAFLLLKGQFGDAQAAGSTPTAASGTAAPASGSNQAASQPKSGAPGASNAQRTPQDASFMDKKNRYTVRLIQYVNDDNGRALAAAAYRHLVSEGFPVVQPILLGGDKALILCAGAGVTKEDLAALRDNARALRFPRGSTTRPFASAFVDEIDKVAAR